MEMLQAGVTQPTTVKNDQFILKNQSSSGGVSSQSTTTIKPGVVPGDRESMRNYMSTRTELNSTQTYVSEDGSTVTQRIDGTLSNYQKEDPREGPDVRLSFPDSPIESETFDYNTPRLAIESFETDVDAALTGEGLSIPLEPEEADQEGIDEQASEGISLVEAVRGLATRMVEFLTNWFGGPEPEGEEETESQDSSGSDGPSDDSDAGGTGIPEVVE
jgi:hypothetical protein